MQRTLKANLNEKWWRGKVKYQLPCLKTRGQTGLKMNRLKIKDNNKYNTTTTNNNVEIK